MIDSATKRTWVQGGVGSASDARAATGVGPAPGPRGDGFGDSIASALQRLLTEAPPVRGAPIDTAPSLGPLVVAERDEEELSDLASFASPDAMATIETLRRDGPEAARGRGQARLAERARAHAAIDTAAIDLAAIDLGGMAVWEGVEWTDAEGEAHSPFSERPTSVDAEAGPRELPTLAPAPWSEADDAPLLLVTKRVRHDLEAVRAAPTQLEQLAPSRTEPQGDGQRPDAKRPDATRPDAKRWDATTPDAKSPEARSTRTTQHGHGELGASSERHDASSRAERLEARRAGSGTHRREDPRDEGPVSRVHTLPVVAVGDREAARVAVGPAPTPSLEVWREPAPNDPPDAQAGEDATPYHVARLGDHRARVELVHPELGRVEVEVTTAESRVDVELLARSLGASIALRASEEELRGELRHRGASLRNYRVRTAAASGAVRAEEEEWR